MTLKFRQRVAHRLKGIFVSESPTEISSWPCSNIIPLYGKFDFGYALGPHCSYTDNKRERTPLGNLIYKFKYKYDREAGRILSEILFDFISQETKLKNADLLTIVPPSFVSRPFIPMRLLSELIYQELNIDFEPNLFARTKINRLQKRLRNIKAKFENIEGAFRLVHSDKVLDKKVLVLDDIYDSGATLDEVTKLLRIAGAKEIYVLVLTKTQNWGRDG
ncbi:MAG: hypothetical protein MUO85_03080 [candidate division Zixibacteria bacterium]|nr:hypothetical protein [candidate division Zixibacteria bacterium]